MPWELVPKEKAGMYSRNTAAIINLGRRVVFSEAFLKKTTMQLATHVQVFAHAGQSLLGFSFYIDPKANKENVYKLTKANKTSKALICSCTSLLKHTWIQHVVKDKDGNLRPLKERRFVATLKSVIIDNKPIGLFVIKLPEYDKHGNPINLRDGRADEYI